PTTNGLVDAKPVGMPLIMWLFRKIGGEEAPYFVPAFTAAVGAGALYGAARFGGAGVLLSILGAATLALDGAYVHSARVLDPDSTTTAWIALMALALTLVPRGGAWATASGFCFGMACLTRYNAALAIVLAVPALVAEPRRIVRFVAGGAPCLATMLVFNY